MCVGAVLWAVYPSLTALAEQVHQGQRRLVVLADSTPAHGWAPMVFEILSIALQFCSRCKGLPQLDLDPVALWVVGCGVSVHM
jgi:hypothetical protein